MRKIIQIATTACPSSYNKQHVWDCVALCDDGSLWVLTDTTFEWQRLADIPQDDKTGEK